MAIVDDLPGLGAVSSSAALLGDLLLNGGEIVFSIIAMLISSPDIWVGVVMYVQRLGGLFGFSTEFLKPLIAIGTVLLLLMYAKRLIERLRSET